MVLLVLDRSLVNTGDGVLGGVSSVPTGAAAVGDALSDRSFAATHAFGLEAVSILGCGGAVAFVIVAVTRVASVVAAVAAAAAATALVDDKLLLLSLLKRLPTPSTLSTVATAGVE